MEERPQRLDAGEPIAGRSVSGGNPLGFALEFREGAALVTASKLRAFGRLDLERLELEVPEIRFPFDVSGGAGQFKHRRCRLRLLVCSATAGDLAGLLAGPLQADRQGLESLELELEDGCGQLGGLWKVGAESVPFTARFVVEPLSDMSLRIGFFDIRLFGWSPWPAVALVGQLARVLAPLRVERRDAAFLVLRPVRDLLRALLPLVGWKVPELEGLRIDRVEVGASRLRLLCARFPDELPVEPAAPPTPQRQWAGRQWLVFREGAAAHAVAEQALADGRLDEARGLYLGRGELEPLHPLATHRMLEIGLTRPERFDDLTDRIRDSLDRDPEDVVALLARGSLGLHRGDAGAVEAFEQVAARCIEWQQPTDAVLALGQAAAASAPSDPQRAVANLERILGLRPDHVPSLRRLVELYSVTQQWYRALRTDLRLAHRLSDPDEIASCHARMARIYIERFEDLDRARRQLDAALTHQPDSREALLLQAEVQERRGQPERAARLLGRVVELAEAAGDRERLRLARARLARLWETALDDPAMALVHYGQVLEEQPDHLETLYKVGRLSLELGQRERATEALHRLLELDEAGLPVSEDVRLAACLGLGRLYLDSPDGLAEARVQFQRAVQLDPEAEEAWQALEQIARRQEDPRALADVLEQRGALLAEPTERLAALLEAAEVAERELGDRRRAESLLRRALHAEPASGHALDNLQRLLREDKRWSDLEAVLVESIRQELPMAEAAERWAQVGELRLAALGDVNGGLDALALAYRLEPGSRLIARRLVELFREHKRVEALVDLVPRLSAEAFDKGERIDLWLEHGRLLWETLQRPAEAVFSFRRALELDPGSLQANRSLVELYWASQEWQLARDSIHRVLALAGEGGLSGPGRTEMHRRLAHIEVQLGNRRAAIEQFRIVLSRFEADEEVATQLARLLRDERRWEELASFYAQRAERVEGEAAAALHTASATIWWDKLEQAESAAAEYLAAVEVAPASEATPARLGSLQRLFASLGAWEKVVDVIRRRIALSRPEDVAPMYMAQAAILSSRLHDEEAADHCWEDALAVDPDYRPALLLLARRRFEQGDYQASLEFGQRALRSQRAVALPAERRAAVALDSARAAWELELLEVAGRMYAEHLEAFAARSYAGADPEAFERLELILREQRQYEELALLIRRWLKSGLVPERHAGLKRSLALLLFEHLEQPDEAVGLLQEQLRTKPDDTAAMNDLANMLRQSARWEQLARLLVEVAAATGEAREEIARREELAELLHQRLHDPNGAIEQWRRLVALGHAAASDRLAGILRQEGRVQELAELLRQRAAEAERQQKPVEAAEHWQHLGELARDELEEPELAREGLQRAYRLAPAPERAEALLHLLRQAGASRVLAELLREVAEADEEPEHRRELLLEHAAVCQGRLAEPKQALASLREALTIEVDEVTARQAQVLSEAAGDWETVADLQEMLIELAEEDSAAARRIHRLGRLYLERLDAPDRARSALERALELDPDWVEPPRDLASVLESDGDWSRLVEVLEHLGRVSATDEERSFALHRAAQVAFERLGDEARGLGLLRRAAECAAAPLPLWLELVDHLERAGAPSEAADALVRVVESQVEGAGAPAAQLRRLAELRLLAGEDEAAIAVLERVLRQEPSDEASVAKLDKLYSDYGRHEERAQMLSALARRRSGPAAADSWLAVGRSFLAAGDDEAAEEALRQALAVVPGHREAGALLSEVLTDWADWDELAALLGSMSQEQFEQSSVHRAVLACWEAFERGEIDLPLQAAVCRLMLRLDPIHVGALHRGARLLEETGAIEEAEALWRRLDEQADRLSSEERYELDLRLASVDFARGWTEEAEGRLKRCIELRPDDPGPRAFLHKLYSGGRRFAERVALLLEEAEREEGAGGRFERLRSAAQLLELELGNPEGAAELYERVVAEQPERLEAWRKLAELYRLTDQAARQREALLRVADLSEAGERERGLRKAARLAAEALADTALARSDWERLLSIVPSDAEALDGLLGLERRGGSAETLVDLLARRLAETVEPAQRGALLRERAELLADRLGRNDEAIEAFEELGRQQPSDADVLQRLTELYRATDRRPQAALALQRRIELAGTERERSVLWLELAELRERLSDESGAIEALRQAASLDPQNAEPLQRLRHLVAKSGDRGLLADTLEALASRCSGPEEELSLRRSIGLLKASMGRGEEARRAFARVLVLDPEDSVAHRFSARLLAESDPGAAIPHLRWVLEQPDLLEPLDRLRCQRQLVAALSGAEPEERIPALEELRRLDVDDAQTAADLAELYRRVGRRRELAELLAYQAERLDSSSAVARWLERADLLQQDDDLGGAAEALERALRHDGEHRFAAVVRLAGLRQSLGQPQAAIDNLELALELRPDDVEVLTRLAELLEETQHWDRLEAALARLLELAEPTSSAALACRLGQVRSRLQDASGARAAFERAVSSDPQLRAAWEGLDALAGDWPPAERGELWRRWAQSPAAGGRRPELLRQAAGALEQAQDPEGSLEALRNSLRFDPDHRPSWRRLVDGLRGRGQWAQLFEALSQWHDREADAGERAELAFELAIIASEQLEQPVQAAEWLEACLKLQPEHPGALLALADLRFEQSRGQEARALYDRLGAAAPAERQLEITVRLGELYEQAGDWERATEAFERALASEGSQRAEVGLKLARLQLERRGDYAAAVAVLEGVSDEVAGNREVWTLLSEWAWSQEDWSRAESATERLTRLVEADQVPGLWLRLGDIRRKQGKPAAAKEAYEQALMLDPAYRQAFERLEQLLAEDGGFTERGRFYTRWARSAAGGPQRAALFLTAGRQLERGGLAEEALAVWREGLQHEGTSIALIEALAPLLGQLQRWEELLDILQTRCELETDEEHRLALAFEMGQVAKEQLRDLERAAAHYQACLARDPEHSASLEELADIRYRQERWTEADELYRRLGDRVQGMARFAMAFRRGTLAEQRGASDEALEHYREAVERNPGFLPARQNLVRLLADAERWADALSALIEMAEVLPASGFEEQVVDCWRQAGRIQRRLLRFDEASESFRRVLHKAPDDLESLGVLRDIATNQGRWEEALEYTRRELVTAPEAPESASRWEFVGDVVRLRQAQPDEAVAAYRKALALDPQAHGTRRKLWQVLRTMGDWCGLLELADDMLAAEPSSEEAAEVNRTLGRALMALDGDSRQALGYFERALQLSDTDLEGLDEVAEVARNAGDWLRYCSLAGQALEWRLAEGLDPETVMEAYLDLARVYQEEVGDVARAAACVRRALELHPRDPELLRRLGSLYASNFDTYREAIEVFRELLGMDPADPDSLRYLARLEAARGDMARSLGYYQGLKFLLPADQEARRVIDHVGQPSAPLRALSGEEWDGVFLHPQADCLLQRIFSILAPYLEPLFPPNFSRFGPDGIQRPDAESHAGLFLAAEAASRLLGARPYNLVLIQEATAGAWLESGPVPTIMLSAAVLQRSTPAELSFFVCREVVKVAMGAVLPSRFSRADTLQLLALLSKLARPDVDPPLALPATALQYMEAFRRVVPAETFEVAMPLVRRYAMEPRLHSVDDWLVGVQRTADRVGLLLCGDLNAVLAVLARNSGVAGGRELAFVPDRSGLLAADADLLALFRFAFSESYLQVRERITKPE